MPFKSKKQKRFFQAIAHGFKPDRVKGPTRAVAEKFIKDSEGEPIKKARGGPVRPGSLLSGRPLPRPGGGSNGRGLGATARVGALSGSSLRAASGLAAKPTGGRRGVGGGGGRGTGAKASNSSLRPRPGRGVNPRLALSGTQHFQAADRLDKIRSRIK